MAQPTPYSRQFNLTNYQTVNPSSPLPAAQVDLEFNSVKLTLDQVLNNLKLIQRDDTSIANASIGYDQLKAELNGFGFNPPTTWVTAHNYVIRDTVFQGAKFYQCLVSHVSGVFATDLGSGDWLLIADFNVNPVETQTVAASAVTTLGDTDLIANVQTSGPTLKKITWANFKTTIWTALGPAIAAFTGKTTPVAADTVLLSDSAASGAPKSVTLTNWWNAALAAYGPLIAALTGKTTPVDADGVMLVDSAASSAPKFLSWANLKAAIASYLRTTGGANAYPTGHLWGLTLSNNAGTPASKIDIAAGVARSSDDSDNLDLLVAITAKDLSVAWAVGSSAGMLATGVAVANGTYHVFEIKRPDTGVVDIAADSSVAGANIAANTNAAYTKKRRIGSIVRSGGSILAFVQNPANSNEFYWLVPPQDVATTTLGASVASSTLTVPTGIPVNAIVGGYVTNASVGTQVYLTSSDFTDVAASIHGIIVPSSAGFGGITRHQVPLNSSSQIRYRADNANTTLNLKTFGWVDPRGRG